MCPEHLHEKKIKLHKTRKKKRKITLLVVSNLTAERLSLHLVGEVPILQLGRYSAEGSWVCTTKHVRSPENCTTLGENWQNKTKKIKLRYHHNLHELHIKSTKNAK